MYKSQSYSNLYRSTLLSPKYVQIPTSRINTAKKMQTSLLQKMFALDLNNESNKIQKEIAECAHLCLHYIQTNQATKFLKLLNIFLEIGDKRIKRKISAQQSLKSTTQSTTSLHNSSYHPQVTIIDEFFQDDIDISRPMSIQKQSKQKRKFLSSPTNTKFSNSYFVSGQSRINMAQTENREDLRKCILNYPLLHNNSLLHEAIKLKLSDIIIELICAGSNIHHRNDIGYSPLLQALHIKDNMTCIIILLAAGCKLSPLDFEKVRSLKHIGTSLLALLKCSIVDMDSSKGTQTKNAKKTRVKVRANTAMNNLLKLKINSNARSKSNIECYNNDNTPITVNESVSVSSLLGRIGYQRIDNIRRGNLRDRLLKANQVANEFYHSNVSEGVNKWKRLFDKFGIGKHNYHQKKLKMRAAVQTAQSLEILKSEIDDDEEEENTVSEDKVFKPLIEPVDYTLLGGKDYDSELNTVSFDVDEGQFSKIEEREISKQLGYITLFRRLRLSKMYDIPTEPRFERGFGTEREQKGVRIISNTFKRINYIDNVNHEERCVSKSVNFLGKKYINC